MKKQPIDIEINNIEEPEIPSLQDILERKNDGERPITLKEFYRSLDVFNSSFLNDVRNHLNLTVYRILKCYNSSFLDDIGEYTHFSIIPVDKLLDSLRLSRKMIESMQASAGTQWLSDDELQVYVDTYAKVYEFYDKIEKELNKIASLQKQLSNHQDKLLNLTQKLENLIESLSDD